VDKELQEGVLAEANRPYETRTPLSTAIDRLMDSQMAIQGGEYLGLRGCLAGLALYRCAHRQRIAFSEDGEEPGL
jgi:hypothetical protein